MRIIRNTLAMIKPVPEEAQTTIQKRLDILTKPQGSLGRLEYLARRYGAIRGMNNLPITKKVICTFAADHGVAEEGVSAFPREVTAQMVLNFLAGGAGINVLGRHYGIDILVVDMGVDFTFEENKTLINKKIARGTNNFMTGPAMSREEAEQSINAGIEIANTLAQDNVDIIGTGDMGIANTTPSSAIFSAITGIDPAEVTGKGTGISDDSLQKKITVIKAGLAHNTPDPHDPLDVLAKVGGFEIGGIAGLIIGAAANKIPVVVDGFISSAGALIATSLSPSIKDYIFTSHKSVEAGHTVFFKHIDQKPLFDLEMRLGEGTGSAIAINLIEASIKILTEMATFEDAKVSDTN